MASGKPFLTESSCLGQGFVSVLRLSCPQCWEFILGPPAYETCVLYSQSLGFVLKAWSTGIQKLTSTVPHMALFQNQDGLTLQARLFVTAPPPPSTPFSASKLKLAEHRGIITGPAFELPRCVVSLRGGLSSHWDGHPRGATSSFKGLHGDGQGWC